MATLCSDNAAIEQQLPDQGLNMPEAVAALRLEAWCVIGWISERLEQNLAVSLNIVKV